MQCSGMAYSKEGEQCAAVGYIGNLHAFLYLCDPHHIYFWIWLVLVIGFWSLVVYDLIKFIRRKWPVQSKPKPKPKANILDKMGTDSSCTRI